MLQWMPEKLVEFYHQIGEMFLKGQKVYYLTITGGEPFVRNDLSENNK